MSPRERRLAADHRDLAELAAATDAISFICENDPPDRYLLTLRADGLELGADGPRVRDQHEVACYLHLDYPRQAPLLVWQTPVFHPNLLGPDRHGGVCLGSWSPSESLADLARRLSDLVAWKSFSTDDPLNREAAAWAAQRGMRPGAPLAAVLAYA